MAAESRGVHSTACHTLLGVLAGTVAHGREAAAQAGQVVQGPNLGAAAVWAVGDVDGDGFDDYIMRLASVWEVHSGATGLALPALTRPRGGLDTYYDGLQADLDADGHDDLYWFDRTARVAEFRSGRDGSLLFQSNDPNLASVAGAADHDADGADDAMVILEDNAASLRTFVVLSGRGGATIASWQFGFSATSSRAAFWVGDVDGDGFVDLNQTVYSFAQQFYSVTAGPDHQRFIVGGSGQSGRGPDTNADGRDELWVSGDLVDAVTGLVVWSGAPRWYPPVLDLDGDGAADLGDTNGILSGRTHAPFPGAVAGGPVSGLGDIDGDGRDEGVWFGDVFELVGGPASSRVRDRGASGTTGNQTRPRIRHRLRPRLGDSLLVDLTGAGGPNLVFLAVGQAADQDLAPLGAPGNRAYVQSFEATSQVADNFGHARRPMPVPNAAALLGLALSLQWAVFDPAANALGLATSNALDIVVGS